ncbi:proteasome subunit alpha [Halogeometricum borinquense DSM 11551]|uniref:Proteasome subunit alpha n=2 Tax=Halogeometricum borinquense TaxID=60847 RepID=E4NT36_HALBP|nr:archaeal proteasome endopeptidase complex subunit alpha [Halogeometricum borinquense]ADQ67029.1 20S proteasome subunit (alpha or beta) [Halogeometricum borinquense DSM 11551]ELY29820.1 proteasome subunit alpha [Halogeometricum borinquense DSM 11551]RYJ13991.1 archaeal proteasome endopeptidase complex subunit alpha [Halogeometricum borinquense]
MNRNDQQAYDRGTSLFSPDGRIYQVEYAREAVKRGAPSVGIRTADGVVLGAQRRTSSSLMEAESIEKIHKLDSYLGAASSGHVADARQLVDDAREESQVNHLRYGEAIGVETLAKTLSDMIQESTQRGGTRPFGASLLIGGMDGEDDDAQPRLFQTDPSGAPHEWKAVAIGSNRGDIQEFLEDEWSSELALSDGVSLAVRALAVPDDEIEAADLSIVTVSAEGYYSVGSDEIDDILSEHVPDADDSE